MLQPEDVLEMLEQANLPGTVDEHPNWRRKLPLALERWSADPRVAALCEIDGRAERRHGRAARGAGGHLPPAVPQGLPLQGRDALVPYLASLGISHVYASPFLKARPGSTHGYDVIDHDAGQSGDRHRSRA